MVTETYFKFIGTGFETELTFSERLLTGERPEPAFLISKPYKVDTVKATISQALFFERKASRAA